MTRQSQDSVSRWLEAAGRVPLLTPAEELHLGGLIRAWQDHPGGPAAAPAAIRRRGLKARDRMVSGNLRLCIAVASKGHHGLNLEDALQVAAIGLQRAAERFDPERGYKFSTFAYWWIRQAISREIVASSRLIRIPSSYGGLPGQIHRATRDLSAELGRPPTPAELAERLGIRESELRLFLERTASACSLDQRVGAGERSALVDVIPAPAEPELSDTAEAIAAAMRLLTPFQREVVSRYHLGEDRLIDVAKSLGICRDAARRAGDQGIRRLRWLLRDRRAVPPPTAGDAEQAQQPELTGLAESQAASPGPAPAAGGDRGSSSAPAPNPAGLPGRGDGAEGSPAALPPAEAEPTD